MRRDTARVVLLTISVAAFLALSLIGSAEEGSGVRLPAVSASPTRDVSVEAVTVAPGDHFWKISERKLQDLGVDAPVGPYWRRVVAENLNNIRSGDPDLIYPGEVVDLPTP